MNQEHGGKIFEFARQQGCRIGEVTDFSASINPLGMSPMAVRAVQENLSSLVHYPDRNCTELRNALAGRHDLNIDQILIGNGSTELIHLLPKALKLERVLIPVPSFSEYEAAAMLAGCAIRFLKLRDEENFTIRPADLIKAMQQGVDAVFLCNPNNPTGRLLHESDMLPVLEMAKEEGIRIILDEAFVDYAERASMIRETDRYPNLIVIRSFTKFYGMPGLRVGYLAADEAVIPNLEKFKPPWSVNHLAAAAATASLMDESYIEESRRLIENERAYLSGVFSEIPGVTVFPSSANYLLLKLSEVSFQMKDVENTLARERILVRNCGSFRGLSERYIRVAVKSRADNEKLVRLLDGVCSRQRTGTFP
ncbi:MAG: threonine-phosphate decarboxylase [Acidobacteria bacterium]|nr:threonine-phosphate decarboxylase [Acidobacteriota bacterium]